MLQGTQGPHWGSTPHGLINENKTQKHQNHWASFNRLIKTPLPPPHFLPNCNSTQQKNQAIQTKHKTNSMTNDTTKFNAKHKNIV